VFEKIPLVWGKKTQRRTPRLIGGTRVGRLIATPHLTETRSIDSIDSLKGGAKTCICARGTTIGQRRSVGAVSTTLLCTQEETIWDGLGRLCLARSKSPPISLSPDARVTLSQRISPKGNTVTRNVFIQYRQQYSRPPLTTPVSAADRSETSAILQPHNQP